MLFTLRIFITFQGFTDELLLGVAVGIVPAAVGGVDLRALLQFAVGFPVLPVDEVQACAVAPAEP